MNENLKRRKRRPPAWWSDAKLGIFIHWTPSSIPAFAPPKTDIGELMMSSAPNPLAEIPYSEWYENSLRFEGSTVWKHHREHYGDRPYASFGEAFLAGTESWDPNAWARTIAATGARYVIVVSKHHDGFCLWPSAIKNPHRPHWHSERDLLGELADAVRAEGVRFGLYYSGAYDWTFDDSPIGTVGAGIAAIPDGDYLRYADAQVRELIDRYRPSILWNDISWPTPQKQLEPLFEYYFAQVPDGVVNDRWMPTNAAMRALGSKRFRGLVDAAMRRGTKKSGGMVPPEPPFFQYKTPEFVSFEEIQNTPFETIRGMDQGFGHNRASAPEDFISKGDLFRLIGGAVATGGNVVMNIGPDGRDASIPRLQQDRLDWLAQHRDFIESVRATRPWIIPSQRDGDGTERFFAARDNEVIVWTFDAGADLPTVEVLSGVEALERFAGSGPQG
ncbi:MAG: alpha-L-fucosidase [Actinobacteria bacterium]|nr:alpha-L-fucosidase [Actinomycetota bacterium]